MKLVSVLHTSHLVPQQVEDNVYSSYVDVKFIEYNNKNNNNNFI